MKFIKGFFQEDRPQSMTRLCTFLLILVASFVGVLGAVRGDYGSSAGLVASIISIATILKYVNKREETK